MNRGYIKLWRKTLDTGLFKNDALFRFWVWCLLKASHKKIKVLVGYQEIDLEPGQFIFGRCKAASALNLSEQTIRTCINSLKSTNNLTIKSTSKFSIVSIINWDIYQSDEIQINQQINQQSNIPLTSNQPTTNHKQECIKNEKNMSSTSNGRVPYQKIQELFNEKLPELPVVQLMTDFRKSNLKSRWLTSEKTANVEWWENFFEHIRASDFLMGKSKAKPGEKPFQATFDWIIKKSNFIKIIEGNYHR